MNRRSFFRPALAFVALTLVASSAGAAMTAAEKAAIKRHPLRGVITRVEADTSSLMVKHEAIPGVMRAMTMRFKVDPEVVKYVKVGDAITGLMSRVESEWRLEDVKIDKPKRTK